MQSIEKLIEKAIKNYEKIESGERSIAKGKVLNESANIVIKLTLLQMTHLIREEKESKKQFLISNERLK